MDSIPVDWETVSWKMRTQIYIRDRLNKNNNNNSIKSRRITWGDVNFANDQRNEIQICDEMSSHYNRRKVIKMTQNHKDADNEASYNCDCTARAVHISIIA